MHHIPKFIQSIFPDIIWHVPNNERKIFLSFDDGPHPEVTPRVLDILEQNHALATFFCLGENVVGNKGIYERIKNEGNGIGNHGFRHLSGWGTSKKKYIENALKGFDITGSPFFRPPYGRLGIIQKFELQKKFKIVMWDIMAGDYKSNITEKQCIQFILDHIQCGSIVVLHDSAYENHKILNILPPLLHELTKKQYTFGVIGS